MKFKSTSIIDTICRELLNQHQALVMLTKNGKPIDRSITIAASDAMITDGNLELQFATDQSIEEIESEWGEILGCDVAFVEPVPAADIPIGACGNSYFINQESKRSISLSPQTHFNRFRREFRETTGLGIEILQADGVPLPPSQSLRAAGAKRGAVEVAPEMKCSEIWQQMKSLGLDARLYTLQPIVDRTRSIANLLTSNHNISDSTDGSDSECFTVLNETLDELQFPEPVSPAYSMHNPFPIFHRLNEGNDSLPGLCERGTPERASIESAINKCLTECDDKNELWKVDTLLSLLEANDVFLNLDKERDDVINEIATSFVNIESAKQYLEQIIEEANQNDDLWQGFHIDALISTVCFAINKAIEEADEEMIDDWIAGFGFADFLQMSDEESVSDIMQALEMPHREELVPAFMSFLKFNFGADVLPEGQLRDELGNADWDGVVSHIVESCF
jgi:hypothetical protein